MKSKSCIAAALTLSGVALIIKSVALSLPHFVDVHLVDNIDDQAEINRIAGVGVFQSEFDATNPDIRDIVLAGNIPPIAVDAPSLEFPLLFPCQQNFFPEVLPLNARNLEQFLRMFPEDKGNELKSILEPRIQQIADVEFNDCQSFTVEMANVTELYFGPFQALVVPEALTVVHEDLKSIAERAIFTKNINKFLLSGPSTLSLTALLSGFLPGAILKEVIERDLSAAVFGCQAGFPELDPDAILEESTVDCVSNVYNFFAQSTPGEFSVFDFADTVARLFSVFDGECVTLGLTVASCMIENTISFISRDVPLNSPAEFLSPVLTPCNSPNVQVSQDICGTGTQREYFTSLAESLEVFSIELSKGNAADVEVAKEIGVEGISGALKSYLTVFSENRLLVSSGATLADKFDNWEDLQADVFEIKAFASSDQRYREPCDSLEAFTLVADEFPVVGVSNFNFSKATCSNIEEYFVAVSDVVAAIQYEFFPFIFTFAGLYQACFDIQRTPLAPELNIACPPVFSLGTLEGLLGSLDFTAECEDDQIDNDKIATAQSLAIASTIFECICFLLLLVAMLRPVRSTFYLAPSAALSGVLGGILIISALFVVQSAPVYDAVGGEPDGLEPVYYTGFVGILAFVDGIVFFICAVLLCSAVCYARGEGEEEPESKVATKSENQANEEYTL